MGKKENITCFPGERVAPEYHSKGDFYDLIVIAPQLIAIGYNFKLYVRIEIDIKITYSILR